MSNDAGFASLSRNNNLKSLTPYGQSGIALRLDARSMGDADMVNLQTVAVRVCGRKDLPSVPQGTHELDHELGRAESIAA